MARSGDQSRDDGFTLVELLVSLAVFSLVAVLLSSGLSFGARTLERNTIAAERAQELRRVQQLLRTQIEGIYPRSKGEGRGRLVDFEGMRDQVVYWSTLPQAFGKGGYVKTRLYFDQEASGFALKIAWCLQQDGTSSGEMDCSDRTLIDDVKRVAFTFYDEERNADLVRWKERQDLPSLVKIDVEFSDDDPRVWPEFAARPRIDKASNCQFDPVSKRCRR
jgi:general secretion pathway protein J